MSDTRTDKDGGTWSDGGKSYEPPVRKVTQRMDAAKYIAGTYAEVGGIQDCEDEIRKAINDAVAKEIAEIAKMANIAALAQQDEADREDVSMTDFEREVHNAVGDALDDFAEQIRSRTP